MSKFLLLLALAGLVSCAGDQPVEDSVGNTKTFEPVISYEDNERVKAICNALSAKEGQLNVLVNSSKQYTFSYAQKNCDETALPEAKDVQTRIARNGNGFYFAPQGGQNFGFSDVETTDDGVMRSICNFGGTLESPIKESSSTAIWWTTFTNAKECQAGFGNLCIQILKGTSKDGYNYKIHTEEYIKFKVLDENEGFFIQRKLTSSSGCAKGKTLEMRATLR